LESRKATGSNILLFCISKKQAINAEKTEVNGGYVLNLQPAGPAGPAFEASGLCNILQFPHFTKFRNHMDLRFSRR
jgi:hypothetical protein